MDQELEKLISSSKLSIIREISTDCISQIDNNQSTNSEIIEQPNENKVSFEDSAKIEKSPFFSQRKFKRNFSTSSLQDHKNELNQDIYKSTRRKSNVEKKKFPFWTNQKVKPLAAEFDKSNLTAPASPFKREDTTIEKNTNFNKSLIDDIRLDDIRTQDKPNAIKFKLLKSYSLDSTTSNNNNEEVYRNEHDDSFEKRLMYSPKQTEYNEKPKMDQDFKPDRKNALSINDSDIFNSRNYAESDSSYISSSENDEDCCNHHHFKERYINKTFNMSVDCAFQLLFNSSEFRNRYYHQLNFYDINVSEWIVAKNKCRTRKVAYNSSKISNIAKEFESIIHVENQILYPESMVGKCYLMDIEFVNGGILDNENFDLINRYCLKKKEENTCQLLITSHLNCKKNISRSLKRHIQMNSKTHLQESLRILSELLFSYESVSEKLKPKDNIENNNPFQLSNIQFGSQKSKFECSIDVMVRIICAIIVFLLIFNAIMYSKLCTLENLIQDLSVRNHQTQRLKTHLYMPFNDKPPIHLSNVDRWKDSLTSTIKFIDRLIQTMTQIKVVMNISNDIHQD